MKNNDRIISVKCPYCGEEHTYNFFTPDENEVWDYIYDECSLYGRIFTIELFRNRILITKNRPYSYSL